MIPKIVLILGIQSQILYLFWDCIPGISSKSGIVIPKIVLVLGIQSQILYLKRISFEPAGGARKRA